MRRPHQCDCRCGCDFSPKTLKAYDQADGTLRWHHWLDNVMLSSDGNTIYGYAYEEDDSPEAMACTMVRLAGTGTPVTLGIAAGGAIRYKKWVRKIDSDGAILGDSAFFWYTGNSGYTDSPIELPDALDFASAWVPDMYGASASGGLLQVYGDYSLGTTIGDYLIVWDDNNTTTTRRYTFVAAAVRGLLSPPVGGAKIRFIAANDGTNPEQTIDVESTIGITAADLATALEAFPHIVSATGTGGPYPLYNVDLEIEWAQDATHFKSVQRQSVTSRGVMTFVRDWDTAAITAVLVQGSPSNSKASLWQFDADDNIVAVGQNPLTSIGSPAEVGIAVEFFTESSGVYSQLWRKRPTSSRPAIWGPSSGLERDIYYSRPAIRAGKMIVGHYPGRGDDQSVGQHSEWHELNPTTGALLSNGTGNNRLVFRPWFASDSKLVVGGHDSFISGDPVDGIATGYYQCERVAPNYMSLMTGLSGTAADYFGSYGPSPGMALGKAKCTADTTAIYSSGFVPPENNASGGNGWNADAQFGIGLDSRIMAIGTRSTIGDVSRVAADGYFSLAMYYRIRHFLASPINCRWNPAGMEWRIAFFSTDSATTLINYTAWLDFDADETDLQSALDTLLGTNDDGPNAFVEGPYYPATAAEPVPVMIWQRGLELVFPANNPAFPVESPPVHYGLNDRAFVRYSRVQVRAAVANQHFIPSWKVSRMDWATGDVIWDVPFGNSIAGGAEVGGGAGILLGENYVVAGNRVNGGCLCTYRWEGYYTPAWVLIFSDCGIKTATPPTTDGTYLGEVRAGTCT